MRASAERRDVMAAAPAGGDERLEADDAAVAAVARRDPDAQVALGRRRAAFSGHSTSFKPRSANISRKPASFHSGGGVEAIEVAVGDGEAAMRRVGAIQLTA